MFWLIQLGILSQFFSFHPMYKFIRFGRRRSIDLSSAYAWTSAVERKGYRVWFEG